MHVRAIRISSIFRPSLPSRATPLLSILRPQYRLFLQNKPTSPPRRHINRFAKVTAKGTLSSRIAADPTLDERIGPPSSPAHLVDAAGDLQPAQPLDTLLSRLTRDTEHLRRVGATEDGTPVCKVVTTEWLIAQLRAADIEAAAAARGAKAGGGDAAKQVELTWAIAENDLGYRLTRMQGFLREGRRVEVLVAPKKRGRRAAADEISGLLEKIRSAVAEVEGAKEWKDMVGEAGKQVELYFEGKGGGGREGKLKELEKTQERMRRKEAAEQERREKEERRLKKKAELDQQKAKMAAGL